MTTFESFQMSPSIRRIASALFAGLLVLVVASPAFGYNEENVRHIGISRLDAIVCATPIRLAADLTDRHGAAVPGATVEWSLKEGESGDTLSPAVTSSDGEGRARSTLTLACERGTRVIKAHVPGDGSARLTIVCKSDTSCTKSDDDDDDDVARISLSRLNGISCQSVIRLEARLRDNDGDPVRGETVKFKLKEKEGGDKLTPKSQKSDRNGKARTYLDLSCKPGTRKVEASSDGKKTSITIRCGRDQGCTVRDDDDDDDNFLVAPLDRDGGDAIGTSTGQTDARSQSSGFPPAGSFSQSILVLLSIMVMITGIGLALGGTRQLSPARLRSRALA